MNSARPVLLLCAFLAIVVTTGPDFAQASKPATAEQAAAVAALFGRPVECFKVTMSTADSTYALVEMRDPLPEDCPVADGFVLARFQGGAWEDVYQGSRDEDACADGEIPRDVGLDLGICSKPNRKSYIRCLKNQSADYRVKRSRPSRCVTMGPSDGFGQSANLVKLRWRNWGRSVATARGIERGFHLPYSNIKVTVRAYRRRPACDGGFIYTRMKVRSTYGTLLVNFPVCE